MTKHFLMDAIAQMYRADTFDKILYGYHEGYVAALADIRRALQEAERRGDNVNSAHIGHVSTLKICQKFIDQHDLEEEMSVQWASTIMTRMKDQKRRNGGKIGG